MGIKIRLRFVFKIQEKKNRCNNRLHAYTRSVHLSKYIVKCSWQIVSFDSALSLRLKETTEYTYELKERKTNRYLQMFNAMPCHAFAICLFLSFDSFVTSWFFMGFDAQHAKLLAFSYFVLWRSVCNALQAYTYVHIQYI